jgi:hypothetical protein
VALALGAAALIVLLPLAARWNPPHESRQPAPAVADAAGIIRLPGPEDTAPFPGPALRRSQGYLGAEACRECHAEKVAGFVETGHYRSTELAGEDSIDARFGGEASTVRSKEPTLRYVLEKQGGGFFQTAVVRTPRGEVRHSERFDVVIGSGIKGETYAYYRGNQLFQLPLAYVSELDDWTGNPGLAEGMAHYWRRVKPTCMFCHATCFDDKAPLAEHGKPEHIIVGISCERCHGPGREHAEHHRAHPDETAARHIVNPGGLSQLRQLDICGQCHAGSATVVDPAFRPGDDLADFVLEGIENVRGEEAGQDSGAPQGFHGLNQFAQLKNSPCFQNSPEMTCTTCHNPHVSEVGKIEQFSKRCQECHEAEACHLHLTLGQRIESNCIDCHMPSKTDHSLEMLSADHPTYSPKMHDHRIGRHREIGERIRDEWLREK